ncbi:S41 family peptidase [Maricaulis sp.]|uniref:S41 family peptidase n=1 Tax=Maricaulis sp. TaxID=1486257 RepID=UPI0025C59AE8|nr:S41 family peptidase [Maricaulis sp.]
MYGVLLVGALAITQESAAVDWSALARADIEAAHREISESHPGPVDPLAPDFGERMDAIRDRALAFADRAETAMGYRAALLSYGAGYSDNHLGILVGIEPERHRWPGFVVARAIDGRTRIVRTSEAQGGLFGAEILECEGRDLDALMRERVFAFRGVEAREVDWMRRAALLFLHEGNPFAPPIETCLFRLADGREADIELSWRAIEHDAWQAELAASQGGGETLSSGMRSFGEGRYWINLPNFNPDQDARLALRALIDSIAEQADELRSADVIVFDLRQNGGGSSAWGREIALLLWGRAYLNQQNGQLSAVDWRASSANADHLEALVPRIQADGYASVADHFQDVADEMRVGLTHGEALVRFQSGTLVRPVPADGRVVVPDMIEAVAEEVRIENPVQAQVLFLSAGSSCASACLDFADNVLATDTASLVGWMTGADSLYMELREIVLPSQHARLGLPTKVYRGRSRGSMEAYQPEILYTGDDFSTETLQEWIEREILGD